MTTTADILGSYNAELFTVNQLKNRYGATGVSASECRLNIANGRTVVPVDEYIEALELGIKNLLNGKGAVPLRKEKEEKEEGESSMTKVVCLFVVSCIMLYFSFCAYYAFRTESWLAFFAYSIVVISGFFYFFCDLKVFNE